MNDPMAFAVSDEHQEMGWFDPDVLDSLNLPGGYRRSIERDGGAPPLHGF